MGGRAKWKDVIGVVGEGLCRELERAETKQLRALLGSIKRTPPTDTNCWWVTYRLVPVVVALVENELKRRRYLARQVNAAVDKRRKPPLLSAPSSTGRAEQDHGLPRDLPVAERPPARG